MQRNYKKHSTDVNRAELIKTIREKGSFLCIGLDPDPEKLPVGFTGPEGILRFNKAVIDAVRPFAVAFKPNIAFYEVMGAAGWEVLGETLEYIGDEYFTLADAKRGDIGNTSRMYARTFFETYEFDAVTVAPYMGRDSVGPFLSFPEKWAVVLALTSNAGADDFQLRDNPDGTPLYAEVMSAASAWGSPENLMFVAGATRPEMFESLRNLAPEHFFLVPGVGAQGGSLEEVCRYGLNDDVGLLVNSSRGILYASGGDDFAKAAAAEAKRMADEMKSILIRKSLL